MKHKRHVRASQARDRKFLEGLADARSVSAAARGAGYARSACYLRRSRDAEFAAAWDDAYEQGTDKLEDEMLEAAKKSDLLKIFQLKARRPEKYRDNIHVKADLTVRADLEDAAARALEASIFRTERLALPAANPPLQIVNGRD